MTPDGWRPSTLGSVLAESDERRGERAKLPVLSVTKDRGIMLASERFSKPLHGRDLARYRVARRGQLVVDPMLLWDGALAFQKRVSEGIVSPDYRVFEVQPAAEAMFLDHLLRSQVIRPHFQTGARGTNVRRNRISRSDFERVPVALPPLPEQRKIAAILSSVDDAIEATQAVIDQLHVVKRAMMAELLTRGLPGRHARFKQTEIGEVPEGWEVVRLLEKVTVVGGQADPRELPYRNWPLVAPNHIVEGTGRLLPVTSAAEQDAISGKYQFSPGDVLYSKIRPYLRKACMPSFAGLCSADMYALRCREEVEPEFLLALLLSDRFTEFATSVSMRTGIPKINREELSQFVSALPPVHEQREVAGAIRSVRRPIEIS